jgi:hypothetical protein
MPLNNHVTQCRLVVTDVSAVSAWPLKSDFKLLPRCKVAYVSDLILTYYMLCPSRPSGCTVLHSQDVGLKSSKGRQRLFHGVR